MTPVPSHQIESWAEWCRQREADKRKLMKVLNVCLLGKSSMWLCWPLIYFALFQEDGSVSCLKCLYISSFKFNKIYFFSLQKVHFFLSLKDDKHFDFFHSNYPRLWFHKIKGGKHQHPAEFLRSAPHLHKYHWWSLQEQLNFSTKEKFWSGHMAEIYFSVGWNYNLSLFLKFDSDSELTWMDSSWTEKISVGLKYLNNCFHLNPNTTVKGSKYNLL